MSTNMPDLSPDQWARARALFDEAVGLPPEEQATYVSQRCGGDRLVYEAVAALLQADAVPRAILDASPEDLSRLLAVDEAPPGADLSAADADAAGG